MTTGLDPVKRLSSSRLHALEQCALKEIWSCNKIEALLPVFPAARLGTVVHAILEQAAQGRIRDEAVFESSWQQQIEQIEKLMRESVSEKHLVPLCETASKYEVKKLMLKRAILPVAPAYPASGEKSVLDTEKWVASKDGKIGGKIDLVQGVPGHVVLIDYKTGSILNESGEAKLEYEKQLKMYAALYFETCDEWPEKLILIGLNNEKHEVSFDREESRRLLQEAINQLDELNRKLGAGAKEEEFASPSPDACRYCRYRPKCSKYWIERDESGEWPVDVSGEVIETAVSGTGYGRVVLQNNGRKISIRQLSDRHSFLKKKARNLIICNLNKDVCPDRFLENQLTTSFILN